MTKTKHTAGPWEYWELSYNDSGSEGKKSVYVISAATAGKTVCSFTEHTRGSKEDKMNVHLITAAPDMLEALERVVGTLEAYMKDAGDISDQTLNEAEAAIKKARGE